MRQQAGDGLDDVAHVLAAAEVTGEGPPDLVHAFCTLAPRVPAAAAALEESLDHLKIALASRTCPGDLADRCGASVTKTNVTNETDNTLCLWVEPRGTEHWMRPGEQFTIVTDADPEESPFNVVIHDQGITVWVNSANASVVFDENGKPAPCGHQNRVAD